MRRMKRDLNYAVNVFIKFWRCLVLINKNIICQLTNCNIVSTVRQEDDEAAWLAARTKGIGGSDIGAICGVSPFSSARQIYLKKTGQYEESIEPSNAAKERMHFGHLLEPIVADEYANRELDNEKYRLVEVDATFCHKDYPWALANIDRLIVEVIKQENGEEELKPVGILECKTTSEYMKDEWENGDILTSYIYQLNWYLWILGLDMGAFACLVGGNKFFAYTVYRNDELINETLLPKGKDFWYNNVLALCEPEMQSTDTEFANSTYSEVIKNSEITLDDDETNELAGVVFECKAKIKELECTMKEAQNRLKDRLKENEIGYCRDYTIKWSPRTQTRVDTNLLRDKYPEIYEACKKTTSFRVMTVKG